MPWFRSTMRIRAVALYALCLCASAWPVASGAMELHGVQLPEHARQGSTELVLNGAGTRSVLFFKVYVAGLYLPHPAHSASSALDMPGPKLMRLVMLRDVSGREMADKLDADLRANLPKPRAAELEPALSRLRQLLAGQRELRSGQVIELRGLADGGLGIDVDARPLGEAFDTPGLFDALLRVWLGPHPADSSLKHALLGDASR